MMLARLRLSIAARGRFIVQATVIMFVNYDRKTFIAQASGPTLTPFRSSQKLIIFKVPFNPFSRANPIKL